MLTRDRLDLLWAIEMACQRCIRAGKCFDVVSGTQKNVWNFMQNCYGGICVIHWCQVFGARSEPTHYSHLFDNEILAQMTKNRVAERLRGALGMKDDQYCIFWKGVMDARDRYLVHNEFDDEDSPKFPDIDLLVKTCLVMRSVVREIIESESAENAKLHRDIRNFVSLLTNQRYLSKINDENKVLVKAVSDRR